MRFMKVTPLVAILALAACEDQQTAQAPDAPPPAAETPATPPAETPPPPTAQAPVQEGTNAAAPTGPDTTAEAPASPAPAAGPTATAPMSTIEPPPPPSSQFATGTAPMAGADVGDTAAILADAPFEAGLYRVGELTLDLSEEGEFTFTRGDSGETVSGDYRVYGDMMTFSNVAADAAPGMFPMTCRIEPAEDGFSLTADGPSCDVFDGQTFARQD